MKMKMHVISSVNIHEKKNNERYASDCITYSIIIRNKYSLLKLDNIASSSSSDDDGVNTITF